nr:MAG TPA: putative tail fiber protein [Caudoviricetes sp.]
MLIALPIAFNNNGYTLVATANGEVSNSGSVRVVRVLSRNQIQIISTSQPTAKMGSYWIAIGK